MRKLIIIGLVAAIGAVAMIQHASAGQNADFCRNMPKWPGCENMGRVQQPDQPIQPAPVRPMANTYQAPGLIGQADTQHYRHGGWQNQNRNYGSGPSVGIYFGLDAGEPPPPPYVRDAYPGQCRNIAFDLRDQGFAQVHPLRCTGPRLIYSAWRDGEKLILYVSRSGRIMRILPAT